MTEPKWSADSARKIAKRIVVHGRLVLETPAHFGNGDSDESVISLQTDSVDSTTPLLPGPSIAGALRSYLRKREYDYGKSEDTHQDTAAGWLTASLFGAPLGGLTDQYGEQSRLLVDDARGCNVVSDYRDGVRISGRSRTAQDKGLYTFQTWGAGTTFDLRLELLIPDEDLSRIADLVGALAVALDGLSNGEITLGARKKRGLGRGSVKTWEAWHYDMRRPEHILAWLKQAEPFGAVFSGNVFQALDVHAVIPDRRTQFTIEANFDIDGSLLIRSAANDFTDMPHLRSGNQSVLSGTSAAGAIRARALKIANTLGIPDAMELIDSMFGRHGDARETSGKRKPSGSRVIVHEATIGGDPANMVQSRVSIDRFTGGALESALFNQQPHWGGQVTLRIELQRPDDREIGLLLLVLKDLWSGDLPLGGESSVGRGRLKGTNARLTYHRFAENDENAHYDWYLTPDGTGINLAGPDAEWLVTCVTRLAAERNLA